MPSFGPAGGLCSTADDLARWTAALHGGRVLSPASYAAMTTPPAGGPDSRYAMGTVVESVAGHRKLWHNGALTSGFNAQLAYYPTDSLTIVVLANAYPAQPEALETALFRTWAGIAAPPTVVAEGPALPLVEYSGTYAVGGLRFVVSVDSAQNGLAMVDPNGRTLPLRHVGGHVFALRGDDTFRVSFDVEGGHAVRLRIDSPRAKAPPAARVP